MERTDNVRLEFFEASRAGDLVLAQNIAKDYRLTWIDVHCDRAGDISYMNCYPHHTQMLNIEGGAPGDCSYRSEVFRAACGSGHLHVAKWLTKEYRLSAADARYDYVGPLRFACMHDHLDVVQWLMQAFALTTVDAQAIKHSLEDGNESTRWLQRTYNFVDPWLRQHG
jgi:hypothetical protein